MISAIQNYPKNAISTSDNSKRDKTPHFKSSFSLRNSIQAEDAFSRLRISMNSESMNPLRQLAKLIDETAMFCKNDGKHNLATLRIDKIDGIVGGREALKTSNPTVSYTLIEKNPAGELISEKPFQTNIG